MLLFVINVSVLQAQTDDALKINDNGNVGVNTSNPTEKLEVNGNIKVTEKVTAKNVTATETVTAINVNATSKIQQNGNDLLPKGAIIMWYGSNTAPAGWAICNGDNGTPDLRDKFVIGASNTKTANRDYGKNTITVENLPEHNHSIIFDEKLDNEKKSAKLMPFSTYKKNFGKGDESGFDGGGYERDPIDFKDYINNLKTNNGNDIPAKENQREYLPKCYALYYIMKL